MGRPEAGPGESVVVVNKKAWFDYVIQDRLECGIALSGPEVKSVRAKNVSLQEAYGRIEDGYAWLVGLTISPYENARDHPTPDRKRKLLLHRREIVKIETQLHQKGKTWIPLSLYFRGGWLKVEMATCVGKRQYDKRESMKKEDARREMHRELSRRGE